jgi:hypothetical protein
MSFAGELFQDGWRKRSSEFGDEKWLSMALHMVESLSALVERQLSVDREGVSLGQGFSVDFRSDDHDASPLDLRMRGTVGANVVGDRLLVRAWVCFYSGELRIAPTNAEYLELELIANEGGSWRRVGWGAGFPGEFDSFATFR